MLRPTEIHVAYTKMTAMMGSCMPRLRLVLLVLCVLLSVHEVSVAAAQGRRTEAAPRSATPGAAAILRQVDRNLRPESSETFFRLVNHLPSGRTRQLALYAAKMHGRRAVALILSPDELRGRAVLRRGDKIWLHIPGELALRDGTLNQSLAGGVFNNADLLMGDFGDDYQPALLEEGADFYVLELTPRSGAWPYTRVVMRVDRAQMLPTTLAQYSADGALVKTVVFEQVRLLSDITRPSVMRTTSEVNHRYSATWNLGVMRPRTLSDETFSTAHLPSIGRLLK